MSFCEHRECSNVASYSRLFDTVGAIVCDECKVALDRDPRIRNLARDRRMAEIAARLASLDASKTTEDVLGAHELVEEADDKLREAALLWLGAPASDPMGAVEAQEHARACLADANMTAVAERVIGPMSMVDTCYALEDAASQANGGSKAVAALCALYLVRMGWDVRPKAEEA